MKGREGVRKLYMKGREGVRKLWMKRIEGVRKLYMKGREGVRKKGDLKKNKHDRNGKKWKTKLETKIKRKKKSTGDDSMNLNEGERKKDAKKYTCFKYRNEKVAKSNAVRKI